MRAAEQMMQAKLQDFHGRISRCAQRCQDTATDSMSGRGGNAETAQAQVCSAVCAQLTASTECGATMCCISARPHLRGSRLAQCIFKALLRRMDSASWFSPRAGILDGHAPSVLLQRMNGTLNCRMCGAPAQAAGLRALPCRNKWQVVWMAA